MASTIEMCRKHVYIRRKERLKKYGRVRAVLFYPDKAQVVGYIIKRPDVALMFKRKDVFVAADRVTSVEGGLEADPASDSWDAAACKRLGVDYDHVIIWDGQLVKTKGGTQVGTVSTVIYDDETLEVERIDISTDSVARKLLGAANIERELILGVESGGTIIVSDDVGTVEAEGGAAAAAGEAWAKAKHSASTATQKAGAKAAEAMDTGAEKAGEAVGSVRKKMNDVVDEHEAKKEAEQKSGELSGVDKAAKSFGKQLGRASHMFSDFKKEFDDASK